MKAILTLLLCGAAWLSMLGAATASKMGNSPLHRYQSMLETSARARIGSVISTPKTDPAFSQAWEAGLFDPDAPAGLRKKVQGDPSVIEHAIDTIFGIRPDATQIPRNGSILMIERDNGPNEKKSDRHLQAACSGVSLPAYGVSWTGSTPSSGSPTNWVLNCKTGYYRAAGSFQCIVTQSCGNNCYNSCCSTYCCSTSRRDYDGDRGDDIRSTCTGSCCSGCYQYCCSTAYGTQNYVAGLCSQCSPPRDPYANNPSASAGVATYSWSCAAGAYGSSTTRTCDSVTGGWSGTASACRLCSAPSAANANTPTVVIGTSTYTWTCVSGYYAAAVSRTCSTADGSWSGSPIACRACTFPGNTASYSGTTVSPGVVRYSCNPGYYASSGPATVDISCDPYNGSWGSTRPNCVPAGVGYYAPGGTNSPTICPAGTYSDPSATTLTTNSCSGRCAAGYFCNAGSLTPYQNACGAVNFYCPPGSGSPTSATAATGSALGYYTTPLTAPPNLRTGQAYCLADRTCTGGVIDPAVVVTPGAGGCAESSAAETATSIIIGSNSNNAQGMITSFTATGCTSSNCGMTAKVTSITALSPGCSVDPSVTMTWNPLTSSGNVLTGNIITGPKPLHGDRCTAGYKVTVTAYRNADASLTGTCTFILTLTEVNMQPQLDKSTSTGCGALRTIEERSPVGKVVTGPALKATDVNRGQTTMFSLSPINSNDVIPFSIGLCDGVFTVNQAVLDYSKQSSYTFNVVVKDTASPPMTDTCQVTIRVLDFNDPPSLTNKAFQVSENTPLGFVIGNVGGTDPDAADIPRLTYSITRADSPDHIAIHPTTGVLTVKVAAINYEAKKSYTYEVTVTDGVNRTPTTIVIDVVDQVDPPLFTSAKVLVVNENSVAPTVVRASIGATAVGMTATDEDIVNGVPETVSFYLDCPVTPSFVVSLAGEVTVATNAVLDFESRSSYACTATAKDARGGTTVMPLTINLVDVNEAPVFRVSCPATLSVNENSPTGTTVGNNPVSAVDVDAGQVIAYTLTGLTPAGLFTVDGLSGQVRVGTGTLDYETAPTGKSYTMNIVATDSGANKLFTTCAVTVNLQNVNEPPTFPPASATRSYTLSVNENSQVDTPVGSPLTATDPEGNTISYELKGCPMFYADPVTGQIKVAQTGLDFEMQSSYTATLVASDNFIGPNGPANASSSQPIIIKLNDQQEPPVFNRPGGSMVVNAQEESPLSTLIGQPITATDPDKGDVVTYSVSANPYVAIDPVTGMLRVAATKLNTTAEVPLFTVTVTASDKASPPNTATMQVSVNVTIAPASMKNRPPVVYNNVTIVVGESTAVGTVIGDAALYAFDPDNDPDAGRFDPLSFQIGNTNPLPFALAADGTLTLTTALDFESMPWLGNNYSLYVSVVDAPPSVQGVQLVSMTTIRMWTVVVRDDNEPCTLAPVVVRLPENVNIGSAVNDAASMLIIRAVDQDYHPPNYNESVKYTITSGNINKAFALQPLNDATKTGAGRLEGVALVTAGPINFEKLGVYELSVTATDVRGMSCSGRVTVNIDDNNDVPTLVQPPPLNVAESTIAGSAIGGPYSATDEDGDALSWQITAGNVGNVFTISPNGQLTLAAAVDFETKSSYSLTIQVSDGRGGIASKVHAVTILDVAEAPVFSGPMAASINENSPQGTVIFTALCKDQDFGDVLTYSITGGSNGVLVINQNTGAVSIQDASYFDYETNAAISPQISCTDKTGLVAKQIVRVAINNLNERPQLLASTLFVTENSPSGTASSLPLALFDQDIADTLSVSIVGGNFLTGSTTPLFTLQANSTGAKPYLYTNAALFDYEGKKAPSKYILTLNITDNGSPQLFLVTQVTVAAVDVNEPPKFFDQVRSIAENSAKNAYVGSPLVATDEDAGQSLYFSIVSGNELGFLKIDACSGQITVAAPGLDFEASPPQHPFYLVIEVTDDGGTVPGPARLATRATLNVTILDQNEAATPNDMAVTVPENSPVGFKIADMGGSDPDVLAVNVAWRTLTYSLVSNPSMAFAINATTGVLSVGKVAPWDFESPDGNVLTAVISVTDGGGLAGTRLAKLVCTITDVNEKPTIQTTPKQVRFQREATSSPLNNISPGTLVGTALNAFDVDDGQTAQLRWDIVASYPNPAAATWFAVEPMGASAGQLSVTAAGAAGFNIDYEAYFNIELLMSVSDPFGLFDLQNITVALVDLNEAPVVAFNNIMNVFEDAKANGAVGNPVNASDPEETALSFSIVSTTAPAGLFSIDSGSGQIRVLDPAAGLDYEGVNNFTAVIEVMDAGTLRDKSPAGAKLTGRNTVTINVLNVNEAPQILPCVLTIPENSVPGTVVGSVAFSANTGCMMDPDGSADAMTAVFNITAQDATTKGDKWPFQINPTTGVITVRATPSGGSPVLNYEVQPTFKVWLTAKDAGGLLSVPAPITIKLSNVNEPPRWKTVPTFYAEDTVEQNVGLPLINFVEDEDLVVGSTGESLEIYFAYFNAGNINATFDVDEATGQLTAPLIVNPALKRGTIFNLTIQVFDKGVDGPMYNDTTIVRVVVTDTNRSPFLGNRVGGYASFFIPENVADGFTIARRVNGTDPNADQQITYTLTSALGNANRPWPFDIRTLPNLKVPGGLCAPINATTCANLANPSGLGEIFVKFEPGATSIDFEAPQKAAATGGIGFNVYDAIATGTDSHETHLQMSIPIKIFVQDMPEAPYFTNTRIPNTGVITMSIPENSIIGTPASVVAAASTMNAGPEGGLFAMDEDAKEGHGTPQHVYSFVGSPTGQSFFTLDSRTGVITVNADGAAPGVLNWEAVKEFNFTVKVVDKTGRSDTALLRMQVADVNEVPRITGVVDAAGKDVAASDPVTVKENSFAGTAIARIIAADDDLPTSPWGKLTFSLQQDAEALPFDINPATGAVTVTKDATNAALLDWEDKRRWTPTVVVTDGGDLFIKRVLNVDVLDVADSAITGFAVADPADEAASKILTVRTSDVYASSHLGMDVLFTTAGGVEVLIFGTNLGRTANAISKDGFTATTATTVTATYGPDGVEFNAGPCRVTTAGTVVTCTVLEGVGVNHIWKLNISHAGAPNNALRTALATGSAVTGFMKPTVDDIYLVSKTAPQEMPTDGDDPADGQFSIVIEGKNFASSLVNLNIVLSYGPITGREYTSPRCVYVNAHTVIKCKSAPGVGGNLIFRLQIGLSPLQVAPIPSSLRLLRYSSPVIDVLSAPRLDTAGGDVVTITGRNYGPVGTDFSLVCSNDLTAPVGVPFFTATRCTVISHQVANCTTSPGIGGSLKCRAVVGGQASVPSSSVIHYKLPQIRAIGGVGAVAASTRGGQQIILTGSQLGPTLVVDATGKTVRVSDLLSVRYGPLGAGGVSLSLSAAVADRTAAWSNLRFTAADCVVSSAHTQIVCMTNEGVGSSLYVQVKMGGQESPVFTNGTLSYHAPVVAGFDGPGSKDANTVGGEGVVINGDQFGPLGTVVEGATYGPTGKELVATGCTVSIAHVQVKCTSALGAGKDHIWLISIGEQLSVAPTTAYAVPVIMDISGPGSRDASTDGGQEVVISGNFFAIQQYLDKVTYGRTGTEYRPKNCTVVSHQSIVCITAPGTGRRLKWVVTVGGQSSPLSAITTSYAAPSLSLVAPSTGRTIGSSAVAPNGAKIIAPITLTGMNLASSASTSVVLVKINALGLPNPTLSEIQAYYAAVDAGDFPSDSVSRWIDGLVTLTPSSKGRLPSGEETLTFSLPEGWGKGRELFVTVDGVPSNMLAFDYNSPSLVNVAPDRVGVPAGFLRVFMDGDSFCSGRDNCGAIFVDGVEYRALNWTHTQISFAVPQPSSASAAKASICWRGSNGKPMVCSQELSFRNPTPNFNALTGQGGWTEMLTTGGEDFYISGVQDIGTIDPANIEIYFGDANFKWKCSKPVTRTPLGDTCPPGLDPNSPAFETCRTYKLSCRTPPGVGAKLYIYVHTPGGDSKADDSFTFSYATPTFHSLRLTQGGFPTAAANASRTDGGAFLITPTAQLSASGLDGSFVTPLPNVPFFGSLGAVPTLGGVLAMTGMNLGSARMDPIIRLTTPDGLPGDLTVIGHNHTAMIAALPAGDGANRKLVLTVGLQDSNVFTFNYAAPTVSSVSPPRGPTTGGTMLLIKGANFGVSLPVIRIGGIICPLSSRFAPTPSQPFFRPSPGHDELECILPPGSGAGLPIVVTVNGQNSPVAGAATFSYTASKVTFVWPAHGPTSGRYPAPPAPVVTQAVAGSLAANLAVRLAERLITPGDRVNITLRGTNFGTSGTVRLLADPDLYGSDPLAPPVQTVPDYLIYSWNDTTILMGLPAGYGFNLSVNVVTPKVGAPFSQPGTSDRVFSYDPPTISAVLSADFASKEDACQRSWRRVEMPQEVMARNITAVYSWYYPRCYPSRGGVKLMIVGESLGMGGTVAAASSGDVGGGGVTVTIAGKPCPIVVATGANAGYASTDNKLFCVLPAGSGYDLPVIVTVGSRSSVPMVVAAAAAKASSTGSAGRRLALEASSSPVAPPGDYPSWPDLFSYDPASIDDIKPNAFTVGTAGKILSVRGYNFGNEPSNTTLMINDFLCDSPNWVASDRIDCVPQTDVVGAKNISLLVANHNQPAIRFDVEDKLVYLCRYGFYGMENEVCLPCPNGGVCPGEERFFDLVNSTAGYWRTNMSVDTTLATQFCEAPRLTTRLEWGCPVLQPCEPPEACLGNNTCAYGYEGPRCAFCLKGKFHRVNGECIKCPQNLVALYLGLGFVLIMAILAAYWLNKKRISLALVAIGVDYFQVVSVFSRAKIKWPQELKDLLQLMSVFNLNIDIVAPECLNPGLSYHMKWFFIEALPLLIIGAFLLISVGKILYKLACTSKRKSQLTAHLPTLVSTSIVVMRLMFLYLCITAIQAMSCLPTTPAEFRDKSDPKNPRDPVLYMNGLIDYECWKPGGWHLVLFPFGLGLFLLWGVVMPVSGFWWLHKNREICAYDQILRVKGQGDDELSNPHYRWRKTWSKLYVNFKPQNYYWEFVVMGRKFLIALVALLFRQAASYQLAMSLLVLFVSFVLHVNALPYLTHANRAAVLDEHNSKVLAGDPMHSRIEASMKEMEKKNTRKRQKQFAFDGLTNAAKQKDMSAVVLLFIFDPNTVESILLASAVLIDLLGVLLDSKWFAGDNFYLHYPEYTAIGVGAVLIISLTVIYYICTIILELINTLCPHRMNPIVGCLGICFASYSKRKVEEAVIKHKAATAGLAGTGASKRKLAIGDGDESIGTSLTLNPFLLKQQNTRRPSIGGASIADGGGDGRASMTDGGVLDVSELQSIDMPTPMFWKTVQGSYANMHKMVEGLNTEIRDLKKNLDEVRGLAATANTSAPVGSKTRTLFAPRLGVDDSESPSPMGASGPAGFVAAGAGAAASLKDFNKLASTRRIARSSRTLLPPSRFQGAEMLISDDESSVGSPSLRSGRGSLHSGALSPGSVASVGRQWHAADQVNRYDYKDNSIQNPMMLAALNQDPKTFDNPVAAQKQ